MFAVNFQDGSLSTALEKTFDGKHPCPLCCAVQSGQHEEKEQQKQLADPVNKVIAITPVAEELPPVIASPLIYFESFTAADPLSTRPPSPPPWRV